MRILEESLKKEFTTQLYSDGTGNNSKDVDGLDAVFGQSNTYGGIDRSTYTWWKAKYHDNSGTNRTLTEKILLDAYTDAISRLPNMKAALLNMEQTLQNSISNKQPFSVLLIDGDNIRAYNNINYAVGDEMIRKMSAVFMNNLRPNDFVARWRSGDEFVVILPDTPIESAKIIGERFRLALKEASKSWLFPTTISIGIAAYPIHGDNTYHKVYP